MRRDPMPAGLLGCVVFAVWALTLAVAAWLGLGSRLPPAEGGGPPAPLPQVPTLADERLADLSHYPQVVSRPLFNEGRRPQPYYIGGDGQEQTAAVRLSGVLITPQLSMATLSGEGGLSLRLQLGGPAVQGWQLLELSERQATVLGPSGSQILPLAVYAGTGAAAAPATASAPAETATVSRGNTGPLPAPPPPQPQPGASPVPATAAPAAAAAANEPSAAQMQAIRARIQARREQMRQNNNGQQTGQNR
ncbi:hypothetical protein ABB30_10960 [Stenotrophomonas ginsengisoli]|uniref:General secretion pathway protein GspN n=1 Tax=Stenotrophomonas ginsengisoli TaxID=336566 RepID=A0A0R0D1V1_9GAMM|nr:hypothetical protein [Stenotrophomonas ginsengisoli]KRG76009.1 hypothetical protein ABB30_10960 [Stenotrophomonas ginsengisoli]